MKHLQGGSLLVLLYLLLNDQSQLRRCLLFPPSQKNVRWARIITTYKHLVVCARQMDFGLAQLYIHMKNGSSRRRQRPISHIQMSILSSFWQAKIRNDDKNQLPLSFFQLRIAGKTISWAMVGRCVLGSSSSVVKGQFNLLQQNSHLHLVT